MFVQVVEFETKQSDECRRLIEEYRAATAGRSTVRRGMLSKDRDQADRCISIVEFDSYEDAMRNSEMPETQKLAEQLGALSSSGPRFWNLDVVEIMEPAAH